MTDVVPCDGAAGPTEPPPAGDTGAWIVGDIETDPMTDAPTTNIALASSSGASAFGNPIMLIVRCSGGETELFVSWNDYLGSDSLVEVSVRVDDGSVSDEYWHASTDNTATFYPDDEIMFIKRLSWSKRLVLQATPYNEGPTTAVFDLAGMSNALVNVREACDW